MLKKIERRGKQDDRMWTVMVFMGADTIQGNAPLVDAALDDITEMDTSAPAATT